jgi:hypothetical protein
MAQWALFDFSFVFQRREPAQRDGVKWNRAREAKMAFSFFF